MSGEVRPIGLIADDITGATDLASALAARGLDTRLAFGSSSVPADGGEAIVVALKIRSVPASDARADAVRAADALRAVGVERFFSKYCSTFDSTAEGNIGPIADALADASGARRVVHCPAYPANGRTVYLGHLFVGDELLSESPMRNHPLTPMRDALLTRVLGEQTPRAVGLVRWPTVAAGTDAVIARLVELGRSGRGIPHVIADALRDGDLDVLAAAVADDGLAAGSAPFGAAFALAAHARAGHVPSGENARVRVPAGPAAIVAGSLSRATRDQVRSFEGARLILGTGELVDGGAALARVSAALGSGLPDEPLLIASDHAAPRAAGPRAVEASERIERTMGRIGEELVRRGVRRLIVAGGETSGAVAAALDLRSVRMGPDISVGVPWIVDEDRSLAVAFKSGNFGAPSFFRDALEVAGP